MTPLAATPDSFIPRWTASAAAERANYQGFLSELCDLLDVPRPDPTRANDDDNAYVFERNVHFQEDEGGTSIGRIDLYKRGAFVLEAKQGSDADTAEDEAAEVLQAATAKKAKRRGTAVRGTKTWDDAMVRARGQADRYARALPVAEGWPPFLIVVDVGHSIELYSEFSRSGKTYVPFPDPQSFRIKLDDLRRDDVRARLRQVWLDPQSLDPSRRAAKVTRELAQRLAELAKLLEKAGHEAEDVAKFLMRSLFTMFAEDVELIPRGSFKDLLAGLRDEPQNFKPAVEDLWKSMNTGGYSPTLRKHLLRFNGGLFAESEALPLTKPMLDLLHEAAGSDWTDVEPAIFGTLLERALDPVERHKLGAHYTPRAYVERLVLPTVIEPLRDDWQAAYVAAVTAAKQGDLTTAQNTVRAFHEQLCKTRVLDPACGSGNFLYVTLEQMKRLEGEVLNALREFGEKQSILFEVDPHQFLGIEVNPRAAAIADLVLWIGYLQWHFRTRGHSAPAEPIIKNYHNIECRDAVLAWDSTEPVIDDQGQPVTRWDGRTMKIHPVTGEEVPDETARTPAIRYICPRKADWPATEYIVGNPPFVGNKRMRDILGDEYTASLRKSHDGVPGSVDFVMYWWANSASLLSDGKIKQFGLITTNSISQGQSRKVLEDRMTGKRRVWLKYSIPDHPWVDSSDGAAVRIAMTVASIEKSVGRRLSVTHESSALEGDTPTVEYAASTGFINPDLTIGVDVTGASPLKSNHKLSFQGPILVGEGFRLSASDLDELKIKTSRLPPVVRKYLIGRDIVQRAEERYVIDLFGLSVEEAKARYPELMQRVITEVKPHRDANKDKGFREKWWLWGRPRPDLREAVKGLDRFIVTVETSKHKPFTFLSSDVCPDHKLYVIASNDAAILATLSSRIHGVWAFAAGGTLEDRPTWTNGTCFLPFPFPETQVGHVARLRELGEQLDAHRKRQQELYPKLTLTDMYNVLEKLRSGEELTAKERIIHEQGLVSILKQIHDDLDAAVFDAYGWPMTLTDDEILERLVALNAERAAEEANGLIRWLRPEFQNPTGGGAQQRALTLEADDDGDDDEAKPAKPTRGKGSKAKAAAPKTKPAGKAKKASKRDWPKGREAQAKAVLAALRDADGSLTADELAKLFTRANVDTVDELLEALATLGQARRLRGGKYKC